MAHEKKTNSSNSRGEFFSSSVPYAGTHFAAHVLWNMQAILFFCEPFKRNGIEKCATFLKLVFFLRQTTYAYKLFKVTILIARMRYYKTAIFFTKFASIITNLLNMLCETIVPNKFE